MGSDTSLGKPLTDSRALDTNDQRKKIVRATLSDAVAVKKVAKGDKA